MKRIINYGIIIKEEDGTPVVQQSGVFPSPAYKTPQDLLQGLADFLNEEYGTHLVVKVDKEKIIGELVP